MTKYPNREALRKAHDIYRDAMSEFIFQYLEKRVRNETVDDLIMRVLNREQHRTIDIKGISVIFKNKECWNDFFFQQFGYDRQIGRHEYDIRSVTSLIVMGRNKVSHPGPTDLDLGYTYTHLFLIAEVLGKIGKMRAKREVEEVSDELFHDDTDERIADMTKQLEAVKAEKTELEKQVKTTSDQLDEVEAERIASEERLKTRSFQLKMGVAGKTVAEERLSDVSNRLEDAEVEKTELEKRLKTTSDQLKDVKVENAAYKKRIEKLEARNAEKAKPKPAATEKFRAGNTLEDRKEIGRKVAELRINSAGSKSMSWAQIRAKLGLKKDEFHKVIRLEDHFQESVVERIESFDNGWEYKGKLEVLLGFEPVGELANRIEACKPAPKVEPKEELQVEQPPEHLPPNADTPDSITFQGTTFTRHLNEYHVTEDDISQSFWHYWHSQGREGKQEMRDAGWCVEKVDGDWKVTISPEDFQAWIEDEESELNSLLNSSHDEELSIQPSRSFSGRTALPTGKEMEQPALKVLADGKEHRRVEIIDYLTEHFSLTADEREYLSKTGQSEKHLMNKGLIERTRTGYYRITTLGLISFGTSS